MSDVKPMTREEWTACSESWRTRLVPVLKPSTSQDVAEIASIMADSMTRTLALYTITMDALFEYRERTKGWEHMTIHNDAEGWHELEKADDIAEELGLE